MVKAIESFDEFKALVRASSDPLPMCLLANPQINGSEPVIVDYWATWCGPCKLISPHFGKLEEKFPGIKFVKVDVDEQNVSDHIVVPCADCSQEASAFAKVKAMPTFQAYKNGNKIGEVVGANVAKLTVSRIGDS